MLSIKKFKPACYGLLFAATAFGFGAAKANAEDVIIHEIEIRPVEMTPVEIAPMERVDVVVAAPSYCHDRFPAVVMVDPTHQGEKVDFYGPCNPDDAREAAISTERNQFTSDWERNYAS